MKNIFVVVLALPIVHCLLRRSADGTQLRQQKVNSTVTCPGVGSPCSGHGYCSPTSGVCWCSLDTQIGYGGTDCGEEVVPTYNIEEVESPEYQDMVGRYIRVPMYLQEKAGDPANIKYIAYDHISGGWVVGKLNSSCVDDICFFAYSKGQPVPPPKGYVYGQPGKHVYYKQLVFDDAQMYPGKQAGYFMALSYYPDPNAVSINPTHDYLSQFTGRYVLQPRWVHQKTGKYAMMPVSLNSPGKQWALLGLMGKGAARRWGVLATAQDPSLNRYTIPAGGWMPESAGFTLVASCLNHISDTTCDQLENHCRNDPAKDKDAAWVQSCCRDTCGLCLAPPSACNLPMTSTNLLQKRFNTSA